VSVPLAVAPAELPASLEVVVFGLVAAPALCEPLPHPARANAATANAAA